MEINTNIQQGLGLDLDTNDSSKKQGTMTFALNAIVTNFDGNEVLYQNEQSNTLCTTLPQGTTPIGVFYIPQLEKTLYFLDKNEIGIEENCEYKTLLKGECLNHSLENPIHQIVVKNTNCGVSVYWSDSHNSMRHFNFEDLPFIEIPDPTNDYRNIKVEGQLDCNKLLVQPNFSIPQVDILSVEEGGIIKTGVYQFVVSYSNEVGESYTSMYNVTNPIPIHQEDRATQDFDLPTTKAIKVEVTNLDTSGIFDNFNLIVLETINGITTPKLVGTYPIAQEKYDILYTGNTSTSIQLSPEQLFQKFQYYDTAKGVTQSDDRLIWYGLQESLKVNYQQIWSKVKLNWISYQLPYGDGEGFSNEMNAHLYKGYMGDEVYPIEGVFILRNGKQTDSCHIPGRLARTRDLERVESQDGSQIQGNKCEEEVQAKRRWEVYNTATVESTNPEYQEGECYQGIYQIGEFAYWESQERYPNNTDIWGELANTPIRHHKFPDELVSPRFKKIGDNEFIYPKGIQIDEKSLRDAIANSTLTLQEKEDIVGFKIVRGDRSEGNMSVMAKGHFTNVGKYTYEEKDYYFPNYPFNSVQEDPLFATEEINYLSGYNMSKVARPFQNSQGKDQFTFHSPDTHFGRVSAIDSGYIKMESIDYGKASGKIVKIKNNAEYKFLTQNSIKYSAALAATMAIDYKGKKATPSFNGSDFGQVYTNMNELFEKLTPYRNFGYNINSVGKFDESFPIPNSGNKIRQISKGMYLTDGFQTIEDGKTLNNTRRESSVYIHIDNPLPYAHEYDSSIPIDNSRFIASYNHTQTTLTPEEIWEKFQPIVIDGKNAVSVGGMLSMASGVLSAAQEVSENDNDVQVLYEYISRIFSKYIEQNDLQGLLSLEKASDDCGQEGTPMFTVYPAEPNTPIKFAPSWEVTGSGGGVYGGPEVFSPSSTHRQTLLNYSRHVQLEITNITPQVIKSNEVVKFNSMEEEWELTLGEEVAMMQRLQNDFGWNTSAPAEDQIGQHTDSISYITAWYYMARTGGFPYNFPQTPEVNNRQREICGGLLLRAAYNALQYAIDAYRTHFSSLDEEHYSSERELDVNAYYGSIKRYLPNQWGRMYSYTAIDTGYYQNLQETKWKPIFGGDTFINKFSLKIKQQVFNQSTVNYPDQRDVALDEEGALGYPMFWVSTKPIDQSFHINPANLDTAFSGIGVKIKNVVASNVLSYTGSALIGLGLTIVTLSSGAYVFPPAGVAVTAVGAIVALVGVILNVVASIVRNKTTAIEKSTIKLLRDLLEQLINKLGIKNVNLDNMNNYQGTLSVAGMIYQYVYGIPTYFVESQVNVDLRQATNDNEGNFYPRVGRGIPDDWLQEDRVPIVHDNSYTYNKTFSKQNRENFYHRLREDFDFGKECNTNFPNRAMWSEKTNLNETLDNWLIYKPINYYDLPKTYGDLVSIDGVKNRQVIVRFENNSQVYNALTTIDTTSFQAYLGNDRLFTSAPPLDIEVGSQHRNIVHTPYGQVFVNAQKGLVVLLQGTKTEVLSNKGLRTWFQRNLPFKDTEDNHYKGVGFHGVYDSKYDRILLTKLEGKKSWTISYTFRTGYWTSWHSYLPNYYLSLPTTFYSGKNDNTWIHGETPTSYTTYYGEKFPYILEYPFTYKLEDEVIQGFQDYTTALEYEDEDTFWEPDEVRYFNKALVSNRQQTTGILNLIPRPDNDLSMYMTYPKYNTDSKDILVSKRDNIFRFNDIVDITKVKGQKIFLTSDDPTTSNIQLNLSNLDYSNRNYNNPLIRAKDSRVRLILDNRHDTKLLSKVLVSQTQTSQL